MNDKQKVSFYAALIAMAIMALPSFAPMILIGSAVWFAVYKLLDMDIFDQSQSDEFDFKILLNMFIDKLKNFKEVLMNLDVEDNVSS